MRRAWLLIPVFAMVATAGPRTSTPQATGRAEDPPLAREDVLEMDSPDVVVDNASEPGESTLIPRWSEVAPPMIPHGIADFVPITRSDNACLDCHVVEEKVAGEPTPIPPSHYRDLRRSPDVPRDTIAGTRYLCISCHVPLTEAAAFPRPSP